MLAVTANWLLTDGSIAPARASAGDGWLQTIRRAVIRAGFRRDGRYEPVECVSLVFAGDTFDWLLSDTWVGRDRPWHGGQRSREARSRVVINSLRANRPLVKGFRRWLGKGVPVPAADAHGRPSVRSVSHARIRLALLSGDRDSWMSEAAGPWNASLQRLGVWVGESWSNDQVTIRHGHDRDPLTHSIAGAPSAGLGRPPALAESLVVDLVVPFAVSLRGEAAVWPGARPRLAALAGAGLVDIPRAVSRLVYGQGLESPMRRRVLLTWRRCVAAWKERVRHEPPACDVEHDVMDDLADWLADAVERPEPHGVAAIIQALRARPEPDERGAILGHGAAWNPIDGIGEKPAPWLMVVEPTRSLEPLGPAAADPPVVTIGPRHGGTIVEAA